MQAPSDPFWDVRAQEREQEEHIRKGIDEIERDLALARRAVALRSAIGFQDFVTVLKADYDKSLRKLAEDERLTDAGLREQRGLVRGMKRVLAILTKDDAVDRLAGELGRRQNLLEQHLRRIPKPREEP